MESNWYLTLWQELLLILASGSATRRWKAVTNIQISTKRWITEKTGWSLTCLWRLTDGSLTLEFKLYWSNNSTVHKFMIWRCDSYYHKVDNNVIFLLYVIYETCINCMHQHNAELTIKIVYNDKKKIMSLQWHQYLYFLESYEAGGR